MFNKNIINEVFVDYGKNFTIHIEDDMKPTDFFHSFDWNSAILETKLVDQNIISIKEYIEGISSVNNIRVDIF